MRPDLSLLEYPWMLLLAVLLPAALVVLLYRARRQRVQRLARLGALDVVRRLVPATTFDGSGWRATRLALAAGCAGLAFAGPRWGLEHTTVTTSGVDVVLAVDASLSMLATDEKPSRLERAKQEIRRLRALSPGDRVGLLAFAGRSYVLTPITVDGSALDLFLDNLDPSVVGQAGTSLAQTITQGTALLSLTKSGADRALVVFSDGEGFEPREELIAAAQQAAAAHVSLVTVGFGTVQGSTIPITENGRPALKKDENGQTVITRYSPSLLQAAATAAGGTFIPAEATDKAARIKGALSKLRTKSRSAQTGEDLTPRFQWFLLPAVLLLWLDTVLGGRRGRRRRRAAAAETALAALALVLLGATGCRPASPGADASAAYAAKDYPRAARGFAGVIAAGDRTPAALYDYGTALLAADTSADSLRAAAAVLEKAAEKTDAETQYRARFNAGLAWLTLGLAVKGDSAAEPLKHALAFYKLVLLARPSDADGKWNFELALRTQKSGGGGGGGGQSSGSPAPADQQPTPQPTLAQRQAEQLLGSAAREERDVQSKKQKSNRPEPPPGGKDW
jgi:Ca-activated chloride channel family protein